MVQRSTFYNTTAVPIPYDTAPINMGNAMNISTGIFTAPRKGVYFFVFTGITVWETTGNSVLRIGLKKNNYYVAFGYTNGANNDAYETFAFNCMLNLEAGDLVWAEINAATNVFLFDGLYDNFSGWLLKEDISTILNIS